jgi:hypothetical protein
MQRGRLEKLLKGIESEAQLYQVRTTARDRSFTRARATDVSEGGAAPDRSRQRRRRDEGGDATCVEADEVPT